jgi:hypothetical protein
MSPQTPLHDEPVTCLTAAHASPGAPRRSAVLTCAAAAIALGASGAAAQGAAPNPAGAPVSLLVAVAAGVTPQFDGYGTGDGDGAVSVSGGVRLRSRHLCVDAIVDLQDAFANGDDVTLVGPGSASYTVRRYAPSVAGADAFVTVHVRGGGEIVPGRHAPTLRMAAGGGFMSEIGQPFASITSGIATRGRHVRLTFDAERWWYRLPVTETTYAATVPGFFPSEGPSVLRERSLHVGERSTFVRIGLELPLR